LREVLNQLPRNVTAAVVLQYWHGLSYEEIAQRLGISTHMVKKYLSQALIHCRRRMARLDELMKATDDRVRELIAEQAADWLIDNRGGLSVSQRNSFMPGSRPRQSMLKNI